MKTNIFAVNMLIFCMLMILSLAWSDANGSAVFLEEEAYVVGIELRSDFVNDLDIELLSGGEGYAIQTTGIDPWVMTHPMEEAISRRSNVLSFEYFCPQGLDHLQVYFGPPIREAHSHKIAPVGMSEGWVVFSADLSETIGEWGNAGDFLRLDFGNQSNVDLQIRNIQLRPMTAREREIAASRDEKRFEEARMEKNIRSYLDANFQSVIREVEIRETDLVIRGRLRGDNYAWLVESTPYQDITETQFYVERRAMPGSFAITVDRFVERDGINYDRMLSRWALVDEKQEALLSHARYPDHIPAVNDLPKELPASRKGLGGFSVSRGHLEDLDDLGITSATVNIWFTRFMYSTPAPGRIEHTYNGKSYYFDRDQVAVFDSTFRTTANRGIVTAAILLVSKAEQAADPEIGRLLQHPDMDPAGIYSMPNMTTPESVECYAAALDFLSSRYSRPDKKYGRINHWIMHNEVDAGWVWTNMGDKTALIFMDAYLKSMRMCYAIARKHNPHSEVFISLTHYWAWTSHPKFYPSKDLMEILLDYTRAEGDFQWALAQHPYPESLREPKTWLDQKVTFTFDTPLITFKNLEVLDAWIKLPEVLYQGTTKRTLWLSENGTNSRTYEEQDLTEQAAGFAYAWKKMEHLDGIDGFQWHNWIDNRREGGLRIGLRRFPDDEEDPGGRKPVWYVFQAAGTDSEDLVFDQYREVIGLRRDWDELIYIGEIDQEKKRNSFRNLYSDTWVAADALGRELPGFEECGPVKEDRFVGMFYFMTHINPDRPGPFDVTKIIRANPKNPQWGAGAHYWGEPETGYYLNYERWMLKRHARQLSDAGVDVIIFDVTNDRTYPQVYLAICEVFREMRHMGEKTPDIAFLASERSVEILWEEFYEIAMYPDLWFHWKGKPLLLFGHHETPRRNKMNDVVFPDHITNFFSIRQSWAWTSLPWYDDGKDEWPWVDHFPQTVGWHESPDKAEMVPVAVAQHPLSNIGRSFHNFHQPKTDEYDLTPFTGQGLFFQEQWDHAIKVDPEFVFVTGWNEWSAGKQVMGEDISKDLQRWNFYPGAHLGKAGKELRPGDNYFIDQYNQEYSRDIEPMKGGHTDNYYYQLMANIRRYKGVSEPVKAGEQNTIDIRGSFSQWDEVSAIYYDHIGDTEHRNSPGDSQAGPYINITGRNDIVECRVAYDHEHYYFYAKTNEDLTPGTDPNWMLLFIDTDQSKSTGWEGYDFVVNLEVIDDQHTTMQKMTSTKRGGKAAGRPITLSYRKEGNELMIALPRQYFGDEYVGGFDFHWADNLQKIGDITDFFHSGDHAPDRRANYRFTY